jgi:glycosyltransferase involved in cell wall biosynthesis
VPLFSVVIPTYNRADLLGQTLESVFRQEADDYEVIVVDDGSTDNTADVVAAFGDRVRFLRRPNGGPGAARNAGIGAARGDYLAFLDSDDLWFPWTLATYAEIIWRENPALIAGRLAHFAGEGEFRRIGRGPLEYDGFADYLAAARRGLYCGSGQLAVRRELAAAVGGFCEERLNAEDHDFVLRLGTVPGFVNVRSPAMIGYRQHAAAITHNREKAFRGAERLIRMEREERYPGGPARRGDRRTILSQHLRSIALDLLAHGSRAEAWQVYRATFAWNLRLGRFQFLAGFLLRAGLRRG